jgi:hypothetical protein
MTTEGNKYLAEAKRQGHSPEHMARAAQMAGRLIARFNSMEVVQSKLTDILCWATYAEEIDREDLQLLAELVQSATDYNSMDFSFPFKVDCAN